MNIEWKNWKNGQAEHEGTVGDTKSGNDGTGLVVGKTIAGEPGKVNFKDEKYQHLWSHHTGKGTSEKVLILF